MPWLTEDHDRLARFRAGDRVVLGEVFRVYAPGLSSHLSTGVRLEGSSAHFRAGASPADVDDVVQETFIRAFADRARASYDGLRPFSGYLVGIARNVLGDWHRTGARRARLFDEGGASPAEPSAREASPGESSVLAGEAAALVRDFTSSLVEGDRLLVELRLFGEASRREVSERTGYSAMRVRTREVALRRQLRARLAASGWLGPEPAEPPGAGTKVKP